MRETCQAAGSMDRHRRRRAVSTATRGVRVAQSAGDGGELVDGGPRVRSSAALGSDVRCLSSVMMSASR